MPVDLGEPIHALYEKALKKASLCRQKGDMPGAASAYRQCADAMRRSADYAVTPRLKKERLGRAQAYLDLAAKLQTGKLEPRRSSSVEAQGGDADSTDYESEVSALIFKSPVTWDDIGGLESTKAEIKSAYGLSVAIKPEGVKLRPWRNILFYGPPGTGKTLLAAATSNGLEATFFNAKVSDLLSKYFGESSRLLSALYSLARKMAPSVVFLDEIESLAGERGSGDSGAERRIVSTFLAELDGLTDKGSDRYVLTIGATNLPWMLDRAMLSRFEKRIYVPLPDAAARRAILKIHIDKAGHSCELSASSLVERTEGYSGREIERLCAQAIQRMVAGENPSLVDLVDKGKEAIEGYRIRVRPLSDADFSYSFEQIKPETRADVLKQYEQWRQAHSS